MTDFQSHTLPRLIELAYASALDPAKWQAFLDALSPHFGGANGILYGYDRSRGAIDFSLNFGNDPAYVRSYVDYYHTRNPYPTAGPILADNYLVGKVISATQAVGLDTIISSEFYNDWMKPQEIPADHLGVLLHRDESTHVTFGLAPNAKLFDRHRVRYARELALLVPHITRALKINRLTAAAQEAERIAGVALEAIDAAAVILTSDGRPMRLNGKAEALMRHGAVLKLDQFGTLHAACAGEDASLASAFVQQRAARVPAAAGPLRLTSQRDGTKHVAWVVGATGHEAGGNSAVARAASKPRLLVLLVHPVGRHLVIPAEDIRRAFDLTSAEARLVAALVAGRTSADYAAEAGLSRHTVRNHLAAAFAKSGTSRQSELVALVIGSLGWIAR